MYSLKITVINPLHVNVNNIFLWKKPLYFPNQNIFTENGSVLHFHKSL